MRITFRINYYTQWGENIFISGNNDLLGNWDPALSFPMTYYGHGEWEATFECKNEPFEYRYLLKNIDMKVLDEGGPARTFKMEKRHVVFVRDFWRSATDPVLALLTKPFTEVLNKPTQAKAFKPVPVSKPSLKFSLLAPCIAKNKQLGIIGNQKTLGNWQTPVPMGNDNFPTWECEFDLSKMTYPIVYKYVLIDQKTGKIETWDEGDERLIFHIPIENEKTIHIQNDDKFRHPNGLWRGAGVAVPIFSLRSNESFGVGEFNDLKKLVDWAEKTSLKMIQVLPVNETVATHSWLDSYPYKAISVIALHPMYLNIDKLGTLKDERLRDEFELLREVLNAKPYVDYIEVNRLKSKYYKLIFDQEWKNVKKTAAYKKFFDENKHWLEPYAAFCFLRDRYKTGNFREWNIWAKYDPDKIDKLVSPKSKHHEHIAVHYFIQFYLHQQLKEAVDYAHSKGVALKGDIPIGISPDSIEAWTLPELFNLNGQAGAPPDDFAVLGQNWGFPTYNWDIMAQNNFSWWRNRLTAMAKYFDAYRIDHILGFFRIWEIPIDAVHGLLGHFKPAMPLTPNDIQNQGIWFDSERFTLPYITKNMIKTYFGEYSGEVISLYLNPKENSLYEMKKGYKTQREIYDHFTPPDDSPQQLTEKNAMIRDGLMALLDEVLFVADPYATPKAYHPRIAMQQSNTYLELDYETKEKLNELYIDFYYHRHEQFWKNEAMSKLPAIIDASNMLVCGEDLGMVPNVVAEVMKQLNILSLEIQRMPKNPDLEFVHPNFAPYLSVCTTSTHDMSTIRGWWEENREKTQRFYRHILGQNDLSPYFAEPWICREIINQHLHAPAIWTIFPIQDLIAIDGNLRWDETDKERINVPSNEKNKWQYRMILSLEELLESHNFNKELKGMVKRSGR